jgi:hypothetical protein
MCRLIFSFSVQCLVDDCLSFCLSSSFGLCAISAYHHKSCEFEPCSWRGVCILCDTFSHWLATGRWLSSVSSTNKTDRHDITEILLKVALNTINQANQSFGLCIDFWLPLWRLQTFLVTKKAFINEYLHKVFQFWLSYKTAKSIFFLHRNTL